MDDDPKEYPRLPPCTLEPSPHPLQLQRKWSLPFPAAVGLCVGDWNSDGTPEILVSDKRNIIHILNLEGNEIGSFQSLQKAELLEIGQTREGPVLVAYKNWGKRVVVLDRYGEALWWYPRSFQLKWGVNGAHWGDIDGDDNDELVIGFNGFGGLQAANHRGGTMWSTWRMVNVWNQGAIPKTRHNAGAVIATEATGAVYIYSGSGKKLARFYVEEGVSAHSLSTGAMDELETVQIATFGIRGVSQDWNCGESLGLDATGKIVWRTPAWTWFGAWRSPQFALGDLDGDGRKEWAFMRDFYELVVCNQDGVRVATLDLQRRPDRFSIVSRNEGEKKQGLIVLKDEIGVECWGPMSAQYPTEFEKSAREEALDPNALETDLVSA